MSFAKISEFSRSLLFRLTSWHAGLLILALGLCYVASYLLVSKLTVARVDTYLKTESEECAGLFALKQSQGVEDEAIREARSEGVRDELFQMVDPGGKVLFETDSAAWSGVHLDPDLLRQVARTDIPQAFMVDRGGAQPQVRAHISALSPSVLLIIMESMEDDVRLVRDSMHLVLLVMLAVWLWAVIVGFFLSRRAIRGIHAVRDAAIDLAHGNTARRVTRTARGDEVDLLANAFNAMADRIEGLLGNLRQTNDSLAHELRSPITGIRGRCELALTQESAVHDRQNILADTIERCDHMLTIINTILEISETDAGVTKPGQNHVDLRPLLTTACEIFSPMAEDAGVTVACNTNAEAIVAGDKTKLQRLFSNLLDNAVKFSGRGGKVTISLETRQHNAFVSVSDTGPGIAIDEQEAIFQRFYRGSSADGRPGNGLGLSLARTIARAHGGDIQVQSEVGHGAEFIVRMPLSD